MRKAFSSYGRVTGVRLLPLHERAQHQHRIGFVQFGHRADADAAVKNLAGRTDVSVARQGVPFVCHYADRPPQFPDPEPKQGALIIESLAELHTADASAGTVAQAAAAPGGYGNTMSPMVAAAAAGLADVGDADPALAGLLFGADADADDPFGSGVVGGGNPFLHDQSMGALLTPTFNAPISSNIVRPPVLSTPLQGLAPVSPQVSAAPDAASLPMPNAF